MTDFHPGIQFQYFKIHNGRVFKDLELPLSGQGVVSVLGDNGVGKSTIWHLFEAVFYHTTPSGHKKDDLTKNKLDSHFEIGFEKNGKPHKLIFGRKKKKWFYQILVDGKDQTPHTYNDAVKTASQILQLTQPEFEGSIHLTQGSQHLLIAGSPAKRREYISNFFGIDDSYDLVLQEAKTQLEATKTKITKLEALEHTRDQLKSEINYEEEAPDIEALKKDLASKEKDFKVVELEMNILECRKVQWEAYNEHEEAAHRYEDPKALLIKAESDLIEITGNLQNLENIQKANRNAEEVNGVIARLNRDNTAILENCPELESGFDLEAAQTEVKDLKRIQQLNAHFKPYRKELLDLPAEGSLADLDEMGNELEKSKLEYMRLHRKIESIQKGECSVCDSQIDSGSIEDTQRECEESYEIYTILSEGFEIQKARNKKIQRRMEILDMIGETPGWTPQKESNLVHLEKLVTNHRVYQENSESLGIMSWQEIIPVKDSDEMLTAKEDLVKKVAEYKGCVEALDKLPEKPSMNPSEIQRDYHSLRDQADRLKASKGELERLVGKAEAAVQRVARLQTNLKEIQDKLDVLPSLQKDVYFWQKVIDAYGPRGLRITQLEKMMDVVIKRLPVYTSILFKERGLSFKHECSASSINIIACREEKDDEGKIQTFEHDISSFSGGEKGKMSTAFILTLADCIPSAKRSNLLILDEVDSALDNDGRFRFTNDLLPMLKQNYDSIFVVSHSTEIQQADVYDQVWTVHKENHWSSVRTH